MGNYRGTGAERRGFWWVLRPYVVAVGGEADSLRLVRRLPRRIRDRWWLCLVSIKLVTTLHLRDSTPDSWMHFRNAQIPI